MFFFLSCLTKSKMKKKLCSAEKSWFVMFDYFRTRQKKLSHKISVKKKVSLAEKKVG